MNPGLTKIIETVQISWYFESPEIDFHIPKNAYGIDYTDTWSSKEVPWFSKCQGPHRRTSEYGCGDTLELYTGVAREHHPITGIHTWVAPTSKIQWISATPLHTRWMNHCEVCHRSVEALLIMGRVDVEEAYSHIASWYHSVEWLVWTHGWRDASFGWENDSMEGRPVLHPEVSSTEAVQILLWSDSNRGHGCLFCTYSRSFPDVGII